MSRNEILAERLAAARKESGYTQDEIADFLKCSRVTVTNYENGRRSPDYDNLVLLAEKYNVTTDYLLGVTTAETTDKDLRYVCDYTGLTDKAVNTLHSIVLQSKGKLHSEKRKRDIEKLIEYVTNPLEVLTQEELDDEYDYFKYVVLGPAAAKGIKYNSKEKADEFKSFLIREKKADLKFFVTADKEEANNAIYALNYLLEKKNISDFLIMIYLYLFVNIDTSKGKTLFGSVLSSIGSDDEMPIQIDTDVLSESFLIKINNYLHEWKCRGIKKVFDLEIGQGGGE